MLSFFSRLFLILLVTSLPASAQTNGQSTTIYVGRGVINQGPDSVQFSGVIEANGEGGWNAAILHQNGTFDTLFIGSQWRVGLQGLPNVNNGFPALQPKQYDCNGLMQPITFLKNDAIRWGYQAAGIFIPTDQSKPHSVMVFIKGTDYLVFEVLTPDPAKPQETFGCILIAGMNWEGSLERK